MIFMPLFWQLLLNRLSVHNFWGPRKLLRILDRPIAQASIARDPNRPETMARRQNFGRNGLRQRAETKAFINSWLLPTLEVVSCSWRAEPELWPEVFGVSVGSFFSAKKYGLKICLNSACILICQDLPPCSSQRWWSPVILLSLMIESRDHPISGKSHPWFRFKSHEMIRSTTSDGCNQIALRSPWKFMIYYMINLWWFKIIIW